MAIEATCQLIKGMNGSIIGISLVAEPEYDAEMFCNEMPEALMNEQGNVLVFGHTVTFSIGERAVTFKIEAEDASALSVILESGKTLSLQREGFLTPGFHIKLPGEAEGERVELERV